MYSTTVEIVNPTGLHARPASDFVKEAKKYASDISIARAGEERSVNAKSIVHLLTLGLSKGSIVEITAEGDDETQAADGLAELIRNGLGE
jgi:phosphocarrier protein